jgi:hypothetical protein
MVAIGRRSLVDPRRGLARRYRIHDRDSAFARSLDESIRNRGSTVLKSPQVD